MADINIIGSGSWGTAVAVMLAENGHNILLWSHRQETTDKLITSRENTRYLPGVVIPDNVKFTSDISLCGSGDLIIMAVPSHAMRETARALSPHIKDGQLILSISKGIEEDTFYTISQIISQEIPNANVSVMSGPSHAEEVSKKIPTANVVASADEKTANYIQDLLMNPNFRIYTNLDMKGVELGGSLKNVIALCAGVLDGLNLGDNTKAALITRGIYEIARLGTALGAKPETFYGLSGMGDLIVTCTSMHSRNRRAGILIGQGKSCEEATKEVKMVVEGIKTCRAAKELSRKVGVEMPIVNQAYQVLFCGMDPASTVDNLMNRKRKHETEDAFLNS